MEQAFEIARLKELIDNYYPTVVNEKKELEALVLSYCKEHPEAIEWFNVTSKRQGEV